MSEEAIFGRLCEKFREMTAVYEKLLYTPVGTVSDYYGLQTEEHFRSVPENGFEPIAPGTSWGGAWQNLWVKCRYTVPEEAEGKKLYILSSCGGREQLLFIDGVPKGIYNSGAHRTLGDNHDARYLGIGRAGRKYELAFECYAGHFDVDTDPYNNYDYPDIPMPEFRHTFGGVKVCTRDDELYTLLYDIRELVNLSRAGHVPFVAGKAKQALRRIDETIVLYPKHASPEAVRDGIRKSLDISRPFFTGGNSRVFGRVGITGHSHMDTAWLWPVSETVRKCARTYSNALHLMEQYPDYRFIQSSTLHSEWMKDYYPSVFADMKKYVAEGRYEPNGGVYVECDGNMTSGEFMIRQFLKGQQFTRENFNYTADTFWLQDTFGYNANIPQIMRGCEVKYFCTNKLGWNELNRFPYESFVWHGLDGSDVIVHFPCTHGFPDVAAAYGSVADISAKDATDLRLVAFGFGDGGGGPTAGMLETAARAMKTSGLPEVESMSVSQFMHELEEQKETLPVYGDELYLEYHRGTLTQLHDVKRMNRKAEYAFRNMEYFNVLAGEPKHPESDKWLKTILKNQFHDILPGTAITEVFELYRKEMRDVIGNLNSAAVKYADKLTDDSDSITLFNTLSFDRHDPAAVEADGYAKNQPSQRYTDVCGRELLAIGSLTLPAFGNVSIDITNEPLAASSPFIYDGRKLTTPYAEIVFDANGAISSFTDKSSGRELRRPGGEPLNTFLFAEDVPFMYDNWEIEPDVMDKLKPVYGFTGRTLVSDGPVEIRLRSTYDIGDGTALTQDMVCYADTPRIDFHTLIDWNSPHRLLKAAFDLNLKADRARCEIQYGAIERPTAANTSWDKAKFEVCNRNYTDLSEPDFGAALLNDCKYGISVRDCNLRLSLHRGGDHPDVTGDRGVHELTYALYPHKGSFSAENAACPGYELNVPIVPVRGKADLPSFAKIDVPNVIAESIKPAEDGSDSFVLRLYECQGSHTTANISLTAPVKKAVYTNFLEDEKYPLILENNTVSLDFRPFEIKTVRFSR